MVKPVAIYADEGTSKIGVASLKIAIPKHLNLTAESILAEQIKRGELSSYSTLVIPGGADLPYCRKLNGEGNQAILQFIEQGGIYVGICAGAYYACQEIDFVGAEYTVSGKRELQLFDGLAQGCLPQWTNGQRFDESARSKNGVPLTFANGSVAHYYYHGGPAFLPHPTAQYQPIARYPDGTLAMVTGQKGAGHYLLSGVHFELQAEAYQQQIAQANTTDEKQQEQRIYQLFTETYGLPIWQQILSFYKRSDLPNNLQMTPPSMEPIKLKLRC